jgi:hypothetical protein
MKAVSEELAKCRLDILALLEVSKKKMPALNQQRIISFCMAKE